MLQSAVDVFACPRCRGPLALLAVPSGDDDVEEGSLRCNACAAEHPIRRGIPRFVPEANYASSFGFEWTIYGDLQYDRLHDMTMTHDRFFEQTGLRPEDLKGKRVLEAGCGGGRFSDVVLAAGAELFAIDLSIAVDKNRELHPGVPNLHLAQASILDLPFRPGTFDLVFCFGVLQHTPDPAASFRALAPLVRPGGRMAVDVYAAHLKQSLHWKYALRPVTKRIDPEKLHDWIDRASHVLFPLSARVRHVPVVGKPLSRLVPLMVHDGFFDRFGPERERRWAVLETLDALTPAYDKPRSARTVRKWFAEAGMRGIHVGTTMHALNWGYADRAA